jgi:hypothetical protein
MVDINFIVTCYSHEAHWPYLKKIIENYSKIRAHVAYCYNGNNEKEQCEFRCKNRGKQLGEIDLIKGGFNFLKNNSVDKWIKLSVDSWLLDEQKILDIFNTMEQRSCLYAGNRWHGENNQFATEIFFSIGNKLLYDFLVGVELFVIEKHKNIECYMAVIAKQQKYYLIPERDEPFLRDSVPALGWTMSHSIATSLKFAAEYAKKTKNRSVGLL